MQFPSYLRRRPQERPCCTIALFERENERFHDRLTVYECAKTRENKRVSSAGVLSFPRAAHISRRGYRARVLVETSWSLLVLVTPCFPCAGKQATPGRTRG